MKALLLTLPVAALGLMAAGCGSTNPTQARFVNAIPDTAQYGTGLDIEFNATKEFTNIAFFGYFPVSGYINVPSGNNTVEGLETGTTIEVFSADVTLNAESQYTMVATGSATNTSKVALLSQLDNNNPPVAGKVEFRAINASPSGPMGMDIYIVPAGSSLTPPATFANLAYRSTSKYVTVAYNPSINGAPNYTMYVTATGTTTPILITQSLSAGSASQGAIRTLVFTDQQNINQLNPLAMVLDDLN
ncbi:MAG: DUF4397 domain-containing protein [Terriglobales bacterium]